MKEIKKLAGRKLVLVTAGIPAAGKSTLVNNLLGLKGEKAAKAKFGRKSVTKSVDYYEEKVHGIPVRIIDTPGLDAKDLSSKEVEEELATLSVLTDGKADLLLYCMRMTDRSDHDDKDERIVAKLTKAFGKEIWRHTILVLTFGDVALNQDEEDKDLVEEFTEDFEKALKKAGVNDVPVKSILSAQDIGCEFESVVKKIQQPEIIGVPVGRRAQVPPNWSHLLFKEIIKKCNYDAIPAMLMLQGISPEWAAKLLIMTGSTVGYAGGHIFGGVVGGGVGAVVGGGVGAVFGAVFGGGVGAMPGAVAGAEIGECVGILAGSCAGGVVASAGSGWGIAELTGLAKIIRARKKVEELNKKKENVDK